MRDDMGVPLAFDRYHKGWYYTEPGYAFKEVALNSLESSGLEYSKALLKKFKGSHFYEAIHEAIDKMIEGEEISEALEKPIEWIVQTTDAVETTGNKWIAPILKAITEKECIDISYERFQGTKTTHHFSPYILKEYRHRWYVIGYTLKAGKVISLGLDRITAIQKSNHKYYRDESFNEEDYFSYCLGIMKGDTAPEKVLLEFNEFQKPYVKSQPLHKSQTVIEETPDKLVVELKVYITHELEQLILSYGEQVKVSSPENLRERIKEKLEKALKNY